MSEPITLGQVEALASRLPADDQLHLAARLGQRVAALLGGLTVDEDALRVAIESMEVEDAFAKESPPYSDALLRRGREMRAKLVLALCNAVGARYKGPPGDSVALINELRDERMREICGNDA